MKTTQYLYNIQPKILADMTYRKAIEYKLEKGKELVGRLLEPHYSERDDERCNAVYRAQSFNRKLLEELDDV